MSSKVFGIDFGTKFLKINKKGDGLVYDACNVIAIADKTKVIAIGDEAFEMEGKAPSNIEVIYPVKYGVIADIKNMLAMINRISETMSEKYGKLPGCEFIVATPRNITEVERRAFYDIISDCAFKPKSVKLVERPLADALGCGLNIEDPTGMMVVDIGADTTEVSIISLNGIVLSNLIPIGGNRLDEDIILNVKKTYNLVIGNKTAENIKIKIGTAMPDETPLTVKVYGRDVISGLPVEKEIDSQFVYDVMKDRIESIVDSIKAILEKTPPEISSDIIDNGICLTGGCSRIRNIDKLFKERTELDIKLCENHANSVIEGLARIMDDERYQALARSPKQANYYE